MDAERAAGLQALVGGGLLLGGCLCRIAYSYLHQVPLFRDFSSLKDHVGKSPGRHAWVLVEGRVQKLADEYQGQKLISEKTGLEGVARLVTKTTKGDGKSRDTATPIPEIGKGYPFMLLDDHGCSVEVRVRYVEKRKKFWTLLEKVYEDKPEPRKALSGERGPNRALTTEYLLLIGTPLAGYGRAILQQLSSSGGERLLFEPMELGSSVQELDYPNKTKASLLNFFSIMLIVAGGSLVIFSAAPLLMRLFQRHRRHVPLQPPQGEEDDIY